MNTVKDGNILLIWRSATNSKFNNCDAFNVLTGYMSKIPQRNIENQMHQPLFLRRLLYQISGKKER